MNWLIDIFSSSSDKARLITTLIAAVIAIIVVLFNQWFNNRRAKNSKLIEKIEEIYTSIIKLDDLVSTIHGDIITNYHIYEKENSKSAYSMFHAQEVAEPSNLDELNREFYRIEATAYMLSGLYFPILKQDIESFKNHYQSLFMVFVESDSFSEYVDNSREQREEIEALLKNIYNTLSAIMKKYMG